MNTKGSKRRRVVARQDYSVGTVATLECGHLVARLYRMGDTAFCAKCAALAKV